MKCYSFYQRFFPPIGNPSALFSCTGIGGKTPLSNEGENLSVVDRCSAMVLLHRKCHIKMNSEIFDSPLREHCSKVKIE